MWPFRPKPRNRRFERPHVLEVRLSSSQQRAARVRMASKAMGASLGTIVLLFLLWRGGSLILNRLVYENPAFAIRAISIQTDGVLAAEQIRRWAGLKEGQNLLALDLTRIRRNLELVPVIQSVAIERVLPQTLWLRVNERVPVAQVLQPLGPGVNEPVVFTLDARGQVMLPVAPSQRAIPWSATNDFLPIITGISYVELKPGHAVESPQVKAALQLLGAFEHSPMAGLVDLRWIDLSSPEVMVVTTAQGGKVLFPMVRLDQNLRRWRAVHDYVRSRGKALLSLDLSVANNVPFTAVDETALPPARPKADRSVHPNQKRKNV